MFVLNILGKMKHYIVLLLLIVVGKGFGQNNILFGTVNSPSGKVRDAVVKINGLPILVTDSANYKMENLQEGKYILSVASSMYLAEVDTISISALDSIQLDFYLYQKAIGASKISGSITSEEEPVPYATIVLNGEQKTISNNEGLFSFDSLFPGKYALKIESFGLKSETREVFIEKNGGISTLKIDLSDNVTELDEVVITGTLKAVKKSESTVAVEVYTPQFFKKNPTPSIFDALQNVNGVRPQLNCSVCNTGDIHINGLEGPYTMIMIDGMPIVSSLSTVYGLSGIPNSLIERIEIVKGPASSLYGSEAVGGLINVITKSVETAPAVSAEVFSTSWLEHNVDLGFKNKVSDKVSFLSGINYYNYSNVVDNNNDNFTDVTLQDRFSFFQKWSVKRPENRIFTIAGRYFVEDRWGGELNWNPQYRGGTDVYGENILTKRYEMIGMYQLPIKEKVTAQFSFNSHDQNSVYGSTFYLAKQNIAFGQFLWDKKIKRHDLLVGTGMRYTYYDDNTPATQATDSITVINTPDKVLLPGIFVQDELALNKKNKLLMGARYDYNSHHGNIFTPRLGYKLTLNKRNIIRLNSGTGFRVVNLFTEDHAALTGSRELIIEEDLKPEQSYNVNFNFEKKIIPNDNILIGLDFSTWYTYFTNQIIPDYATNSNQIRYGNLDGHAESKGVSLNADVMLGKRWKLLLGGTLMDVNYTETGITNRPFLTEKWTGTWAVTYTVPKTNLTFDYTGNIYGSMKLPLLNDLDPRQATSPVWSIQNIKVAWGKPKGYIEWFAGVKNLLNWTPNQGNPFLIARTNDPFDKNVQFDASGQAMATANNPYGLTFDPTYVYAPNQGIRFFAGLSIEIK